MTETSTVETTAPVPVQSNNTLYWVGGVIVVLVVFWVVAKWFW